MTKKSKSNQKKDINEPSDFSLQKSKTASHKKIQKYVEEKIKKITQIMDIKKKYRIEFSKQGDKKLMGLYEGNKKVILGEYNFYGIYQPITKLWIWASSIPGVDIKHIKQVQKIKQFSHLFESDSDAKMNFYFQLLNQDVLFIPEEEMLDWINDLILYLSEDVFNFNPVNSEQNVQFLTLANIKQKYV